MRYAFCWPQIVYWIFLPFMLEVVAQEHSFTGISEPFNYSTISATVPGRIAEIKRKEGDFVKRGGVVLVLEKDVEELEAQRRKLIADSKVELKSASNQVAVTRRDYEATKQLFDATQSVSEEELWKKELDYKLALSEYEKDSVSEERETIESKIAIAELNKRIITAPFDGTVVKVFLKLGESCNAQEPLVKIVDTRKCRFIVHAEAPLAQEFTVGKSVNITILDSKNPLTVPGQIEFSSPVVDPSSGLREIRVVFDNRNGKVQPGVKGTMTLAGKP